jgi:hypothetical protein
MRSQEAGQELAQDCAKILPGVAGGRLPMASRFHDAVQRGLKGAPL